MVNNTEKQAITLPFTPKARKLFISKLLLNLISDLEKIDTVPGYPSDVPPYVLYEAHDNQVANTLEQLVPSFNFTDIPYSSTLYFELQIKSANKYIKTSYNGQPL